MSFEICIANTRTIVLGPIARRFGRQACKQAEREKKNIYCTWILCHVLAFDTKQHDELHFFYRCLTNNYHRFLHTDVWHRHGRDRREENNLNSKFVCENAERGEKKSSIAARGNLERMVFGQPAAQIIYFFFFNSSSPSFFLYGMTNGQQPTTKRTNWIEWRRFW